MAPPSPIQPESRPVTSPAAHSEDANPAKRSVYNIVMKQQAEGTRTDPYTPEAALHRPVPAFEQPRSGIGGSGGSEPRFNVGSLTRTSLPYLTPWYPVPGPNSSSDSPPPDFTWLTESCGGKAAIGVFGGAVCGLVMGVFLGAMSDMTPPVTVIGGKEVPQAPLREQMRTTMRATGDKCIYWSRNFAFITGVFGGTECLVEKYRGKHDVWNSAIGGCVTGAALQAKQGPQAAAIGCGGFAAFSLVIDSVFPH